MSVVGLTFGIGANAIRPERRERGERRDQREHARALGACARTTRSRPPARRRGASKEASDQLTRAPPAAAAPSAPAAAPRPPRAAARRPAAEDARGLRREVPAAAEHLGGRRVGDGPRRRRAAPSAPPTPRRTRRRASRRAPRRPRPRARAGARRARRLWPRSMPAGRLVEADHRGRLAAQHDREREPLALAAGEVARVAVGEVREAGGLERVGGELVADALVQEVVAGVLQQQRHAAGPLDPAAGRLRSSPASTPQQRRLARRRCGPSARPSRPGATRGRRPAGPPARAGARATRRRSASAGRRAVGRRRRRSAPAAGGRRRVRRGRLGRQAARRAAPPRVAGPRPAAAQPGEPRTAARPACCERRAAAAREEVRGGRRRRATAPSPSATTRSAAGQAALEPVLGEHDRGPPLLVEAPQDAEQLVAGDRVELGGRLVEQQQRAGARRAPRRARRAGARRRTARASSGRAGARSPSASAASSTPRATAAGAQPRFSSGNASSARTVPITTCVSGSWNSVPGDRGQLGRAVLARVEPADQRAPGELAAVEVRHEPGRGAQQRRLARARAAGEHDELARLDAQRDVAQRRPRPRPDTVGHAVERRARSSPDPPPIGERQQRARPTSAAAEREHSARRPATTSRG